MKSIEWVFFDIGGVILDDTQIHMERMELILQLGRKLIPSFTMSAVNDAYISSSAMNGGIYKNALRLLVGADYFELVAPEFRKSSPNSRYQQLSKIRADAAPVLRRLAKRFKLGLMANQPASIRSLLSTAGILELFSCDAVSEDLALEKPDIRYFEAVLQKCNASQAASLLVDDNWTRGLLPAKQLGMTTILFERKEMPSPSDASPDYRCTSFLGLENIFQRAVEN